MSSSDYLASLLESWLPDIIDAHRERNVDLVRKYCRVLAEDLMTIMRGVAVEVLEEAGGHIHDWEYDDQGGYECSCGETKRRDW